MIAIDTNILVYAFDTAYHEKREISKQIVQEVFLGKRSAVVTNQILAEFCAVVTKKVEKPLSKEEAQSIIGALLASGNWNILNYNSETVLCALALPHPFWDALIIQTLKENNIDTLLTENVKHFQGSGLKIQNPFQK